jgi:hypothetical protein
LFFSEKVSSRADVMPTYFGYVVVVAAVVVTYAVVCFVVDD